MSGGKETLTLYFTAFELPWWLRWKRLCLQCRRPRFNPSVGNIPWRREWQPTPVFLPGESHGQRSLVGYSPWCRKESNMTEQLTHFHSFLYLLLKKKQQQPPYQVLLFMVGTLSGGPPNSTSWCSHHCVSPAFLSLSGTCDVFLTNRTQHIQVTGCLLHGYITEDCNTVLLDSPPCWL